jgi:hypothetical protein
MYYLQVGSIKGGQVVEALVRHKTDGIVEVSLFARKCF